MEIKKINQTVQCLSGLAHTINPKSNNVAWLLKIKTTVIHSSYNKSIISFAMLTRTQKLLRIFRAAYAKRYN